MFESVALEPSESKLGVVTRQISLGQQIASAVRREIVSGRLKPGTRLPQDKLCAMFDVSRIPVRDALLILANEGFVVRNRRNQMIVTEFASEDLLDTFRSEAYLCGLAARRAAQKATDEDIAELDAIIERGESLSPKGDRDELAKLSWQFHHKVNRMAGSVRLLATLRAVSIPLLQDFMRELPTWWDDSQVEHTAIRNAIKNRDSDTAQALMSNHFAHAGDALIEYLDNLPEAERSLLSSVSAG